MDVDPVVRKRLGPVDDQDDGEEVAVLERLGRRDDLGRRGRVHGADQVADRQGREEVRPEIAGHPALGIRGDEGRDGRAVVLDPHDPAVEVHRPALPADPVAHRFPHLAGTEPRILKLVDQGLDHLALARLEPPEQAVHDRRDQAQALDPLRRPVGRDLAGRHAPDLLGVGLEEDLEEHAAEPIDDPVLEASLGPDRLQSGLEVAEQDPGRTPRTELPERVDRLERVVEELAVVVDPAQPRAGDEARRPGSRARGR